MKKLCSLFLILLLTLSLAACGEPESTEPLSTAEPPLSETFSADTKTDSDTESATTDASSDADTETVITDTSGNSDNSTTDTVTDSNGGNPSTDEKYIQTTTQEILVDPTVDYTEFQGENVTLPEPPGGYDKLTIMIHNLIHPHWYSLITTKELADGWTQNLIETLLNAPETGVTAEKLCDKEFDIEKINNSGDQLPINRYTRWFVVQNTIFRYETDPEYKLYRVESHFGAGKEVELSQELKKMLNLAISYAPKNYYRGTWTKEKLHIWHAFSAEHDVDVSVDKITQVADPNSIKGGKYTVTLTLQSQKDLSVNLSYSADYSSDNLGAFGGKAISLQAGKSETVVLEFSQFFAHDFTLGITLATNGKTDSRISISVNA